MTEAELILARANQRAAQREAAAKPIDYTRMQREYPKQKAALTRAINSGNADKVILACRDAVNTWREWGMWPDDWARWQRALDDVLPWRSRVDLMDL